MGRIVLLLSVAFAAGPAWAKPQAQMEDCGWLVLQGSDLIEQPDAALKPSDPDTLAQPPANARAGYCVRDTLMTYVGDQRMLEHGLPLVIRSGKREGVLQADPTVIFKYHKVGDRYRPNEADH